MAAPAEIATAAIILHILSAVVWVGGMFFAHQALRPAMVTLEPGPRFLLWLGVLERFFAWVFAAIVLLLASGYVLVVFVYGGLRAVPLWVNLMQGIGIVMMLIFLHLFFAPWRRFRRAVARADWTESARQLGQVRRFVTVNLLLGLIVVAIGGSGHHWG